MSWKVIIQGSDPKSLNQEVEKHIPSDEKKSGFSKAVRTRYTNEEKPIEKYKDTRTNYGENYMVEEIHHKHLPDGKWQYSHWNIWKWIGGGGFPIVLLYWFLG